MLNILEKFNEVEIDLTSKISPEDKNVCEVLQAAYDAALAAIKQQKDLISKNCTKQKELIEQLPDKYLCSDYLGDTFSPNKIDQQSKEVHELFVSNIANWFARHYSVELDRSEARDALIPKEPNRWDLDLADLDKKEVRERIDELSMEYQVKMDNLHLRYEDVLNWILQQLDGFSFEEKALNELKLKCHSAATGYGGKPIYEQKKAVVAFDYCCSYSDWRNAWEIHESDKDIIRGLAAFDLGSPNAKAHPYTYLLGYSVEQQITVIGSEKVEHVKLFKNGHMHIRFKKEEYARTFIEEYLA